MKSRPRRPDMLTRGFLWFSSVPPKQISWQYLTSGQLSFSYLNQFTQFKGKAEPGVKYLDMKPYGGVEVWFHAFQTPVPDEGVCAALRFGRSWINLQSSKAKLYLELSTWLWKHMGVEVWFHAFQTPVLNGGECAALRSGRPNSRNELWVGPSATRLNLSKVALTGKQNRIPRSVSAWQNCRLSC